MDLRDDTLGAMLAQPYMIVGKTYHLPMVVCSKKCDTYQWKWSAVVHGACIIYCAGR